MKFQRCHVWMMMMVVAGIAAVISALMVKLHKIVINEQNWWIIVNVMAFDAEYARFPSDVPEFIGFTCNGKDECVQVEVAKNLSRSIQFSSIEISDFLSGRGDLVLFRSGDWRRQDYVNRVLRSWLPQIQPNRHDVEVNCGGSLTTEELAVAYPTSAVVGQFPSLMTGNRRMDLRKSASAGNDHEQDARRLASEKNQVMDELLARPDIPSDYGAEMIALYRDRTQDVYTRDFAVQHIGLYAETLNRRGTYDPSSREAGELRRALWDASGETSTIVAAAAFRALADLAAFDPKVDAMRLENRLVLCIGDASAAPAARVMAVQICGERGVSAARQSVRGVLDDAASPAVLRKAAECALRRMDEKGAAQ